jgi:DNA-binding NarL/FixJ family response regulator
MRILIADDSELIRRGIGILLAKEQSWQVCGEASDGPEALRKVRELRPDLVLLDISMPGANGFDASRQMRQEIPGTKILIISHHDAAQMWSSALEAGADGCLDKSRLSLDLVSAIKDLQYGNGASPPKI